jgi:hypothetical protein
MHFFEVAWNDSDVCTQARWTAQLYKQEPWSGLGTSQEGAGITAQLHQSEQNYLREGLLDLSIHSTKS